MAINRKILFLENILIYGIGSAMNMAIPFIMLPIVTRLLPSSEYYGINDTVTIFVSFGSAIATMGLYDAMYRFYFDDDDPSYRKRICSSTLATLVVTGFLALLFTIIFQKTLAGLLFSDSRYAPLIIIGGLNIWITCISTIVAAPTRIRNQRLRYLVLQTIIPVISYSFSILLILKGEYVYALPVASLLSNIVVCIIFSLLNRHDFSINCFNMVSLKPMLRFGVPLMPAFVFFWVLSSVGRIVITNTWGLEYTGIYAVAGKIASLSQLIYSAFAGGWQYFAFSTMKDKDYVVLISRVFDYLSGVSFFATAALVLVIKPIFTIMLPAEYVEGIVVAPALFLAPLILMLRQTVGMHFQVKKMSVVGTSTIGIGAVVAVALYFLLTPYYGVKGAAIASLVGYVTALLVTIVILKRMKLILISERIYLGAIITIILLWIQMKNLNIIIVNTAAIIHCFILLFAYRYDVVQIIKGVCKAKVVRKLY